MQVLLRKACIRDVNYNFVYGTRTPIPVSHGFHKFWMTEAVKSKMNPEAREIR
jgi:hypothetical protein